MMKKERSVNIAALAAAAKGDMDNFRVASTPGGIEAQEKAGQAMLVANSTLPGPRQKLEQLGVVVGKEADDLFYNVTLPAGWKKVATEHSMWSDLVDEKGRKRAGIFYKAAFYDRKASISLNCRYGFSSYSGVNEKGEPVEGGNHTHYAVVITDCDKEIHRVGLYQTGDYKAADPLETQAAAWLDEHFPKWKDVTAYWD
jgi:hypothetical protein